LTTRIQVFYSMEDDLSSEQQREPSLISSSPTASPMREQQQQLLSTFQKYPNNFKRSLATLPSWISILLSSDLICFIRIPQVTV
jgi:hypothetical protein